MYRFSANSRATISSTAIFLSQQSRQYFSSPRGSETSFAPHSAHRDCATDLRGIRCHCINSATLQVPTAINSRAQRPNHREGLKTLLRPGVLGIVESALLGRSD